MTQVTKVICDHCLHKQHCVYSALTKEQQQQLCSKKIIGTKKKGANLYQEGDHASTFYMVRSGLLKHVRKIGPDLNYFMMYITPNEILGLASLRQNGVFLSSAVALTEVSYCAIPNYLVWHFVHSNFKLSEYFFERYEQYLTASGKKIFELVNCSAKCSVAKTLLLLDQYLPHKKDGWEMKREELAEHCNMTRETLSRQLAILKKAKVVIINNNLIKVANHESLKKWALSK